MVVGLTSGVFTLLVVFAFDVSGVFVVFLAFSIQKIGQKIKHSSSIGILVENTSLSQKMDLTKKEKSDFLLVIFFLREQFLHLLRHLQFVQGLQNFHQE